MMELKQRSTPMLSSSQRLRTLVRHRGSVTFKILSQSIFPAHCFFVPVGENLGFLRYQKCSEPGKTESQEVPSDEVSSSSPCHSSHVSRGEHHFGVARPGDQEAAYEERAHREGQTHCVEIYVYPSWTIKSITIDQPPHISATEAYISSCGRMNNI